MSVIVKMALHQKKKKDPFEMFALAKYITQAFRYGTKSQTKIMNI